MLFPAFIRCRAKLVAISCKKLPLVIIRPKWLCIWGSLGELVYLYLPLLVCRANSWLHHKLWVGVHPFCLLLCTDNQMARRCCLPPRGPTWTWISSTSLLSSSSTNLELSWSLSSRTRTNCSYQSAQITLRCWGILLFGRERTFANWFSLFRAQESLWLISPPSFCRESYSQIDQAAFEDVIKKPDEKLVIPLASHFLNSKKCFVISVVRAHTAGSNFVSRAHWGQLYH